VKKYCSVAFPSTSKYWGKNIYRPKGEAKKKQNKKSRSNICPIYVVDTSMW